MRKLIAPLMAVLTASLLPHTAFAAEAQSCEKIRVADIGWTDNTANNGLATAVAQGLGYSVVKTTVSTPIAMSGLKSGQLDVFLDYWSPALDPVVAPFRKTVTVLSEPNMQGAKYTLAVPKYLYDAGLRSFNDLEKFKDQLDGRIYGIEPGSGGNGLIKKMIDGNMFNLSSFKMVESSEAAMLVQVQRAARQKAPIVFLGWSPHPMNIQMEIAYLKDGDKVFGPDYGAATVYTVLSTKFDGQCANASRLFKQIRFTPEMESAVMEKIMAKQDPVEVAKGWLRQHSDVLPAWLSGVTTIDGKDGLPAVRRSLGL